MTLDEVKQFTQSDATLRKVIEVVRTGRWHDTDGVDISSFRGIRNELTVSDNDILLRDTRLVIPTALRSQVIQLAHKGHQGITKTKALLRSKVWFPGMDRDTETVVQRCVPCQVNSNRRMMEPLNMTTLPRGPWVSVSIDFCGPLPTGEYLLSIIDEYSRFPIVHICRRLSADTVILIMETAFATFQYPETIKTDNGPPFQGKPWTDFMASCGIRHRKITPLWPLANTQVENFNRPILKAIRATHVQRRSWRRELEQFIKNYRCTSHSSTLFTPHRLFFGRDPRTKLPELQTRRSTPADDATVRTRDAHAKARMKRYADDRAHATQRNIEKGEVVLVQQKKVNKLLVIRRSIGYAKSGQMVCQATRRTTDSK